MKHIPQIISTLNMKANFLLLLTSLLSINSYSQIADTTAVVNSRPRLFLSQSLESSSGTLTDAHAAQSEKWRIISKENISFKTYNIQMSAIENEITDLESLECSAVKKRDTITLMRLWARDFTLDKKTNELVYNKTGLPNYLSFGRMIETVTAIDNNTVFTSGYELFQEIKNDWKLEPPAKRKYSHTWTRRNGLWKLTTKRTD